MIFLRNCPDHPAGIFDRNGIVGDVFYHNTPAADHNITPNRNAGHDRNTGANSYIAANCNGVGIFQPSASAFKINGMSGSMKSAVRSNKYIVPKGYFCTVQNHGVMIDKEIFANFNVVTVASLDKSTHGFPGSKRHPASLSSLMGVSPSASSALPAAAYPPGKLEDPPGVPARFSQGRGRRLAGASQGR